MTEELNIIGKTIEQAGSSLTTFFCSFADGNGLLLQALCDQQPSLQCTLLPADKLPRATDAVCQVDWTWILGSTVLSARFHQNFAELQLDKAGPLKISVQIWQQKPFLAFQPFRSN